MRDFNTKQNQNGTKEVRYTAFQGWPFIFFSLTMVSAAFAFFDFDSPVGLVARILFLLFVTLWVFSLFYRTRRSDPSVADRQ